MGKKKDKDATVMQAAGAATEAIAVDTDLNNLKKAVVGSWVKSFTYDVKSKFASAKKNVLFTYQKVNKFQENNKTLINIGLKAPAVIGSAMALFNFAAPYIGMTAISYGTILAPISAVVLPFIVANPILVGVCATALAGAAIGLIIYKIYKTEVAVERTIDTAIIEKVNSKDENKTVQVTLEDDTIHKKFTKDEKNTIKDIIAKKEAEKKAEKKDKEADLKPKEKTRIEQEVKTDKQKESDKTMISDLAKESKLKITANKREVKLKRGDDNKWSVKYDSKTPATLKKICDKMIEKLNIESRIQARQSGGKGR